MGNYLNLINTNTIQLTEVDGRDQCWVHALPIGKYQHPVFGELNMTMQKVTAFAESVKNKVRGIDPSINYQHQGDGEAAGWVKDAKVDEKGLHVLVEWTKEAAQKVKDKTFKYFSAEYYDTWKNQEGKEFKDVLFGGALTNRPFMKNLLPINLSESSVSFAIELVAAIENAKKQYEVDLVETTSDPGKEVDVDLKVLCEKLGLPDGSTEAVVMAKLSEMALAGKPEDKPDDKKVPPTVPEVKISKELKTLAEENSMVAALIETVDAQNKALNEFQVGLREADIMKHLSEFDNSNIVLTPRAKDLVHDFLLDAPVTLHERFWEIMGMLKSSSGLLVELGERAGTSVKYGRSKDHVQLFMDEANRIAQDTKVSLTEAMETVARDNPTLYAGYRANSYGSKE